MIRPNEVFLGNVVYYIHQSHSTHFTILKDEIFRFDGSDRIELRNNQGRPLKIHQLFRNIDDAHSARLKLFNAEIERRRLAVEEAIKAKMRCIDYYWHVEIKNK